MNLPPTMTAVAIHGGKGPAESLYPVIAPVPTLMPGQMLIRVHAAGVNRPDLLQRRGAYPPPPGAPDTLGLEVAGEVVISAGRWRVGDKVCALLGGGGYAGYAACDPRHALPWPQRLSASEAAGLPETVFTVFANVFEAGALRPGETLLVHGATSGIGLTAIQLAKALGAKVVATARSADKASAALNAGTDVAVDTSTDDFARAARDAGGADVVLDMVGAPYFAQNLDALNSGGRIVYIAAQGGDALSVPILRLMQKRAILTGSTLRARSADEKARLAGEIERRVWPWIAAGKVHIPVDRVFPLAEAAQAHAWLEQGGHVGKVILRMS